MSVELEKIAATPGVVVSSAVAVDAQFTEVEDEMGVFEKGSGESPLQISGGVLSNWQHNFFSGPGQGTENNTVGNVEVAVADFFFGSGLLAVRPDLVNAALRIGNFTIHELSVTNTNSTYQIIKNGGAVGGVILITGDDTDQIVSDPTLIPVVGSDKIAVRRQEQPPGNDPFRVTWSFDLIYNFVPAA